MAACQGKLTPRVLWPLCRWTIGPCIQMKHPVAVTEPLFVSAVVPLLSLPALMSFSDSVGFQSSSVYRSFTFKWPHPDSVPACETNLVCWGSVTGVRKVTRWRGNSKVNSKQHREAWWDWGSMDVHAMALNCHGSPIMFPRCSGRCSRCSAVTQCWRIRTHHFCLFCFSLMGVLLVGSLGPPPVFVTI